MNRSIWIGYDPREAEAYSVARDSIVRQLNLPIRVHGVVLSILKEQGLYRRDTELRPSAADKPVLWDVISGAPMSTEFAISRFLVPHLAGKSGWALFMDCDMYARVNLAQVFDLCEQDKAVMCVKHNHKPKSAVKMDGQTQTQYARKNWSSFMLFNLDHPANSALTLDVINTLPGRDLHRFCWLDDSEIGELDPCWNFLVGHSDPKINPKIVHFTEGGPWMQGYEDVPYADEWRTWRNRWAA
jgi:lipopolysaccharide biosynthesis glycosyltransferase